MVRLEQERHSLQAAVWHFLDRYWIYEIGPREGNRRKGKVVSQDTQEDIRD
jgi:hypothetical protein